MVYLMLKEKGRYEEYELADFILVATFHDIGAYRTESGALQDMLRYESRDSMAHSIYGYLFLKYLSPVEHLAKILMYHHMDYDKLAGIDFEYKEVAQYINIAERMEIYSTAMGAQFNMKMFQKLAGTKLSPEGLDHFYMVARKYDIFGKILSGEYKQELDHALDYMIFSNEGKRKFVEMLMYCQGFRSEYSVVDAITTVCICDKLAEKLMLDDRAREELYYGALIHDIGMLAIPTEIIEAPRKLEPEEMKLLRTHVEIEKKYLTARMKPVVVDIAVRHHERIDGSGYPAKLKGTQMSQQQKILQVADTVTGLTNKRSYREARSKDVTIRILQDEVISDKLNRQIVNTFITYYDEIMEDVGTKSAEILKMYQNINLQYDQVSKKFKI